MKRERFNARLLGVVAIGLALACGSGARIAAPSTSRAGEFSASVAAPTTAARIGWEIFGSASATAADGLKIIVTGAGTFVAPAGGGGTSSAATGGGTWETRDASDAATGSGNYTVTGLCGGSERMHRLRAYQGARRGSRSCESSMMMGAPGRSRSVAGSRTRNRVASRG